jgi:hypothetical protein
MAYTLQDSYAITATYAGDSLGTTRWRFQSFTTGSAYTISRVKLKMYKTAGATIGTITVGIRATGSGLPTGSDLCSGTFAGDDITATTSGAAEEITFDMTVPTALDTGTKYAIVVRAPSSTANTSLNVLVDSSSPAYTGGNNGYSENSGSSWTAQALDWGFETYSGASVTYVDMAVTIIGSGSLAATISRTSVAAPLVGRQRIVVCGKDQVWFEDS